MKSTTKNLNIFSATILTITIFAGCTPNDTLHQYPFQTAKIEYKTTGTTKGTSTLTIKGDQSIRETHIVFHKKTGDENQDNLLIDDGRTITSIDLNKKIGSTTINPDYENLNKLDPSQRQDYLKKVALGYSPETAATQELKLITHTTFAGQRCEVYITPGLGQICLWNAIPLRTTIMLLGINSDTVVTSISTNIDVPDSTFEIPKDIKITDNTK